LLQLVPADYGALGISSSGKPQDFEWVVARLPSAFFAAYPDMAAHDFVRTSVARRPNVVLRDQEMVNRPALEANMMYRRAREVGVPLEQVMAVMLHIDERWQSGLSLYRDRRRPFTERDRATMQDVTPAIVNAVRNCHLHSAALDRGTALELLAPGWDQASVLVVPPAILIEQTGPATRLIEKWFDRHERRGGRLPEPLASALARATSSADAPRRWTRREGDTTLDVAFVRQTGGRRWRLLLRELCHTIPLPAPWRSLLTPKQQAVTSAVLRGWTNRLVADEVDCTTDTVKVHMKNIFDRLGLSNRATLIATAAAFQDGASPGDSRN
jgi:DNA-binding CsgD family transcriptional regulator